MAVIALDTAKVKSNLQRIKEELDATQAANTDWVTKLAEAGKQMSEVKILTQVAEAGDKITVRTRQTANIVTDMIANLEQYDREFKELREASANLDI